MTKDFLIYELQNSLKFFLTVVSGFHESDSDYAPQTGVYTVAAQIEHAALTVEWFIDGAFGSGFNMDFEEHDRTAREAKSISQSVDHLKKTFAKLVMLIETNDLAVFQESLPEGSPMEGPKYGVLFGVIDHTAHHRGALSQYLRSMGKVPPMPYM